ncbi:protein of unknown function [Modestobacter italicus]|uniref:Uncharacterized protein n=1 Tax=Modestobacter italicus (strain DSM 44449 / CECT 9708 / BC 501) TaxID=2732864 RepID=I4F0S6_MODI5|nr:protein of unknown function [Modestobacter marinus]
MPSDILRGLDAMGADWPADDVWICDFDAGHPGEHWTIAAYGDAGAGSNDLWLRWLRAHPAELIPRPSCDAVAPSRGASGPVCLWVEGHPGRHFTDTERW